MARWHVRHHDDAPSAGGGMVYLAAGLLAGLAAGAYLAHRLGGVAGISSRVRRRFRGEGGADEERGHLGRPPAHGAHEGDGEVDGGQDELEDDGGAGGYIEADELFLDDASGDDETEAYDEAEAYDDADALDAAEAEAVADGATGFASADPDLEDRVLAAFNNDPVLSERAVDIGAVSPATIELTGTVYTREEAEHATVLAGGVPGVGTVVNRLSVRRDEVSEDAAARHYAAGDPRYTEAQWENETIGTGRPRQGTSQDVGRHADPKVPLEERALSEAEAIRDSADDTDDLAERRRRRATSSGDRTGGAPVAPSGVPKADHVRNPEPPSV